MYLHMIMLTVNRTKSFLLYCKLHHTEIEKCKTFGTKFLSKDSARMFCRRSTSMYYCLQWMTHTVFCFTVSITIWWSAWSRKFIRWQKVQLETKIWIWIFVSDWIFCIDLDMIMIKVAETNILHCKHQHMVVDAKLKIQSETGNSIRDETMNLNLFSANEIFVSRWTPHDDAYRG